MQPFSTRLTRIKREPLETCHFYFRTSNNYNGNPLMMFMSLMKVMIITATMNCEWWLQIDGNAADDDDDDDEEMPLVITMVFWYSSCGWWLHNPYDFCQWILTIFDNFFLAGWLGFFFVSCNACVLWSLVLVVAIVADCCQSWWCGYEVFFSAVVPSLYSK